LHYALSIGIYLPKFERSLPPPSSGSDYHEWSLVGSRNCLVSHETLLMSGESGGIQKETAVVYLQVFNKTL